MTELFLISPHLITPTTLWDRYRHSFHSIDQKTDSETINCSKSKAAKTGRKGRHAMQNIKQSYCF